jgi:hypothetical protein
LGREIFGVMKRGLRGGEVVQENNIKKNKGKRGGKANEKIKNVETKKKIRKEERQE